MSKIISTYDEKRAMPIGIIGIVVNDGYWDGTVWVKTRGSGWSNVGQRRDQVITDGIMAAAQDSIMREAFNISPCPGPELLIPMNEHNFTALVEAMSTKDEEIVAAERQTRVSEAARTSALNALNSINNILNPEDES